MRAMAPGHATEPGARHLSLADQASKDPKMLTGKLFFISRAMPPQCQRRRRGWRKTQMMCRAARPVPEPASISTNRPWLKLNVAGYIAFMVLVRREPLSNARAIIAGEQECVQTQRISLVKAETAVLSGANSEGLVRFRRAGGLLPLYGAALQSSLRNRRSEVLRLAPSGVKARLKLRISPFSVCHYSDGRFQSGTPSRTASLARSANTGADSSFRLATC